MTFLLTKLLLLLFSENQSNHSK